MTLRRIERNLFAAPFGPYCNEPGKGTVDEGSRHKCGPFACRFVNITSDGVLTAARSVLGTAETPAQQSPYKRCSGPSFTVEGSNRQRRGKNREDFPNNAARGKSAWGTWAK